jgi:hypothetical protein
MELKRSGRDGDQGERVTVIPTRASSRRSRVRAGSALAVTAVLLVSACASDGGDDDGSAAELAALRSDIAELIERFDAESARLEELESTVSSLTASSTAPVPPSTTTPSTTALPPTTTAVQLAPGDSCRLGSTPDCIDPEGDGTGVFLLGGADCIAAFPGSPELCTDLDGDCVAGYGDSG